MGNLNSSVNDLDVLRHESKLRLKNGVAYQPQQQPMQQYDPSTQSQTRTQPGHKDISYYTGSNMKKSGSGSNLKSNLNLGRRMENYTPKKKTQVSLNNV